MKRNSKTGAGYHIPKDPRKSLVIYGHMVDPNKKTDPIVINDKMIRDHVKTSKQCFTTRIDFLTAMRDFANNCNIQWTNVDAKANFLRDCELTWDQTV